MDIDSLTGYALLKQRTDKLANAVGWLDYVFYSNGWTRETDTALKRVKKLLCAAGVTPYRDDPVTEDIMNRFLLGSYYKPPCEEAK